MCQLFFQFLETSADNLTHRTYNVAGMSFTPEQIAASIRRVMPEFRIEYKICPVRQAIGQFVLRNLRRYASYLKKVDRGYGFILGHGGNREERFLQPILGPSRSTIRVRVAIGAGNRCTTSTRRWRSCSGC